MKAKAGRRVPSPIATARRCGGGFWLLALLAMTGGCRSATTTQVPPAEEAKDVAAALPAPIKLLPLVSGEETVSVDGHLDEPHWAAGEAVQLLHKPNRPANDPPFEGGRVTLFQDGTALYVGATLTDSDIVQNDPRDQQRHYETGDVVEVFLKPEGETWYWEYYATPNGARTAMFHPGRGRYQLRDALNYVSSFRSAVTVDGTLNDWRDRDSVWHVEFAIPLRELMRPDASGGVPEVWRIAIGRYNYSRYLPQMELSVYPLLPRMDFHGHEHWARFRLTFPAGEGDAIQASDPAELLKDL